MLMILFSLVKKRNFGTSIAFVLSALLLTLSNVVATAQEQKKIISTSQSDTIRIISAQKKNPTTVEVLLSNQQHLLLNFYSDHIFRMFQDSVGTFLHDPVATPPAKI